MFREELTRGTVTSASRIMLPTYTFATFAFGVVFTFDPLGRIVFQHSLVMPTRMMGGSMLGWGFLFFLISAVMACALLTHKRLPMALALCTLATVCAMWVVMTTASIFLDPKAAVGGPIWWMVGVAASVASTKSIITGEK